MTEISFFGELSLSV